jgi:hypothetical protein
VKKLAVALAIIVFSIAIFLPFSFSNQAANAQTSGFSIQSVDQKLQVLYSGHVVITENIVLSGQLPGTFALGLPYKYASSVLEGLAYDSNSKILPITLGVQLQGQSGFYGAVVTLTSGSSNSFTVIFVLSNTVLTATSTTYNLDFPAYLGFTQTVESYTATVALPDGTVMAGIEKTDGVINASSYQKQNMAAFTYSPAIATFTASTGYLEKVNIPTLSRQININPSGAITCSDTYKIANNSTASVVNFLVNIPVNASSVVARDQFGRVLSTSVKQTTSSVFVQNVTLAVPMNGGDSTILTLGYSLPRVSPTQAAKYSLNLDLFAYFNYYVDSATVTITPPEGATIISPALSQIGHSSNLARAVFQETMTINRQGVSFVDSVIPSEDIVSVTFDYNSLWIAFRPTSWTWAVVLIGVLVVALWTRPKTKTAAPRMAVARVTAGLTLSPEHIKDFTEAYEEKGRVNQELRALEARAQHGRIPRRRYKVQRRTLELRLETLSNRIAHLKEVLRSAGGSYADIVRQLEAADVELNEVQLSLQNIEVRHESGQIPLESYKKQLTDIERRREKAEATVNGLLLRLRGEIR